MENTEQQVIDTAGDNRVDNDLFHCHSNLELDFPISAGRVLSVS
jgi:hypothetical protein